MVDAAPVPTFCVSAAWWPSAFWNDSLAWSSVITPWMPAAGIWICVPPSNSMPKLKPRKIIDARHTSTSAAKKMYQRLRLPTTSNAPVPT